jgi:hypothetical protein
MYNGSILVSDTSETIKTNWDKQVVRVTGKDLKEIAIDLQSNANIDTCQVFGNELHLVIEKAKTDRVIDVIRSKHGGSHITLEKIKPGMEDIYLSYMQGSSKKDKADV